MPEFPPTDPLGNTSSPNSTNPADWKSSLMDLIAARSEIIRLELADFRQQSARRAAFFSLGLMAAASGWLLLLAGSVPLLANALHVDWPVMALILAAAHIVLVGVFLTLARRHSGPAFPTTVSEFQKDREWIENLSKTPKS